MLFCVPTKDVPRCWGHVEPLLAKAALRSDGDFATSDIYQDLISEKMQLLIWSVNDAITAACVLEIYRRNRKKICSMPLIGGKDMKFWIEYEPQLIEYARQQGCTQLEGYCRDGWLRVLKNWKKVWTTMRRDI